MHPDWYRKIADVEEVYWWNVSRRAVLNSVLRSLDLGPDADILEVGCGSGGNLALLSRFGSVCAFEMDDYAREVAEGRQVAEVRSGSLPADVPFEQRFDLVVMLDVLEHIEDDHQALMVVRQSLREGGRLLITVPAYRFLWSEHDVVNHHKRRYVLGGLVRLLEGAGCRVEYGTYFNTFLFPAQCLQRCLSRIKPKKGVEKKLPPAPVNRLLTTIFSSERHLVPTLSLPFGGTVLVVASVE